MHLKLSLCEDHGENRTERNPIQLKARREEEKEVGRPLIHVFKIQTGNERWFLSFSQDSGVGWKKNRAGDQREIRNRE